MVMWNNPGDQRSPSSGLRIGTSCQVSGSTRSEIKGAINVMCLNHLKTTLVSMLVCGKIVFQETGPWGQKVGDHRYRP